MKKIIIIGGGFSGLAALARLSKFKKDFEITLIDSGKEHNFLPMLPDVIGREINARYLTFSLENFSKKVGFKFINDRVKSLDLEKKEVFTESKSFIYDYLIIACGSETNFYGNEEIKRNAYKLDNASDAARIHEALQKQAFDFYVVAGGGYTGIEVATNLRLYLDKKLSDKRVIIVERAPSILGPLPQWMKDFVSENLRKMKIEVLTNSAIEKIENGGIKIQGGTTLSNAMLIWAAGVKIPDFMQGLKAEKNPQGRIKVDEYLRLNENCFVAGDASLVAQDNGFLRMAVQFAIMQGECIASNIVRSARGKKLIKYKPVDFGYIIPIANNLSCGIIMGKELKGKLPTFMHYMMCVYRSYGLKNKIGIIRDLFAPCLKGTLA